MDDPLPNFNRRRLGGSKMLIGYYDCTLNTAYKTKTPDTELD